jgi:hypothetical protein
MYDEEYTKTKKRDGGTYDSVFCVGIFDLYRM